MGEKREYLGEKFGRWTILEYKGQAKNYHRLYLCRCECGTEKVVQLGHLKNGRSASCGCLRKELFVDRTRDHVASRTHLITFAGQTLSIADWSKITGINYNTLKNRLQNGMSVSRALTMPPRKINKRTKTEE